MNRRARSAVLATTTSLLYALAVAHPAAAETGRFARKLGGEVNGLAVALFLAIAGLVALPILARRDVNGGVVLLILVVLLGSFVYAPEQVVRVVTDLWRSLSS